MFMNHQIHPNRLLIMIKYTQKQNGSKYLGWEINCSLRLCLHITFRKSLLICHVCVWSHGGPLLGVLVRLGLIRHILLVSVMPPRLVRQQKPLPFLTWQWQHSVTLGRLSSSAWVSLWKPWGMLICETSHIDWAPLRSSWTKWTRFGSVEAAGLAVGLALNPFWLSNRSITTVKLID